MKCITDIPRADLLGKKVLVRIDLNVELGHLGQPSELFKLEATYQTLEYLRNGGAVVALVSHLGRPGGVVDPLLSLRPFASAFPFPVTFVADCVGPEVAVALQSSTPGAVLLLENVRFHIGEEQGDVYFARELTRGFDIFVNEAFAVCHRDQASITQIPELLPTYAGIQLVREVETLTAIRDTPARPAVAIIGGAKIETKLPLIELLASRYDTVLVGGRVANEALDQSLVLDPAVHLPTDFPSVERFDIGIETREYFASCIQSATTVVWNGPLGWFEEPRHRFGTEAIIESIVSSHATTKVVGGGETIAAINMLAPGALAHFTFVSTGGGAMLDFLTHGTLPGIEALHKFEGK